MLFSSNSRSTVESTFSAVASRVNGATLMLLAAICMCVAMAGSSAAPAYAESAAVGKPLAVQSSVEAQSALTEVEDIPLVELDGTTTGMLNDFYLGKKYVIIAGRYNCLNTQGMVAQASSLLEDSNYSSWSFLAFDVDDEPDSFSNYAPYQADRLRFFTGMDYNSWAWDIYHNCGGGYGSVTLPMMFAVDEDGNVLSYSTGPCDLAEFIDQTSTVTPGSDEPVVVAPNVKARSQEEIVARMAEDDVMLGIEDEFATEPVNYSEMGELSDETKTLGLGMLNTVRFVAGLDDVVLDADYGQQAQAAAFVNASIGKLSHHPDQDGAKPSGMSDAVWNLGCEGASHSNLCSGYANLSVAIVYAWMSDSDYNNITSVGHRRWCLNPAMAATGFGVAGDYMDRYYAMYSFDESASGTQRNVVWPAQNMPYELFHASDPWSISVGQAIRNPNKVTVTLTRKSDGKVWTFDKQSYGVTISSSDPYFFIDDGLSGTYSGQLGCIIFKPDGVSYKAGDEFHVEAANVNGTTIAYDVKFFEGFAGFHEPDDPINPDDPDDPDNPGTGGDLPAEVQDVVNLIALIPDLSDLSLYDEDIIDEAAQAYAGLNSSQKALVPQKVLQKLQNAISKMENLIEEDGKEDIADYWAELEFQSAVYSGKRIQPPVYVDWLREGEDYKVTYKNNVNIGTAMAIVTGMGDYKGSITLPFQIKPAKAAFKSVKAKKKSAKVKIKAQNGGVSYQVQYRTGKGAWKSKVTSKTSLTIKKLKSKKAYQVRVRAFKKVNSKTYYGAWSKVKKVKIK